MRVRVISIAAMIAVASVMSHAARAEDWTNISNYPARVQSLRFAYPIDQNHSVTWGGWSVGFGQELPVARYVTHPEIQGSCPQVEITGLICTNAVDGAKSCSMALSPSCASQRFCSLGISTAPAIPSINIDCPDDIAFSR